ncbi:MAG: DEAD/DEAH box helicase family protein [SAR324 cluster bacterium]|nr:DEAD/DEAH box helicase family protein [SAR324 cluster bacterium]
MRNKIIYNKLVRDKIPEIIQKEEKQPLFSKLKPEDQLYHLRLKLIEESQELFCAHDASEFIKEAADVLEVLQSLARQYSVSWSEVEASRILRNQSRGGFGQGIFLHTVLDKDFQPLNSSESPYLPTPKVITRTSFPSLMQVLTYELENSVSCRWASAFCTRSLINRMIQPLKRFLESGGEFFFLTSVMNHFNHPDDLLHLHQELHPGHLRVYYPEEAEPSKRFIREPPPFHLKCFLFRKKDGRHALIVGSSNLTGGGLFKNEEWNFYSNSEVNLPFGSTSLETVFESAERQFDVYWKEQSVEISDAFLSSYRSAWEHSHLSKSREAERPPQPEPEVILPRPGQQKALEALAEDRHLRIQKAAIIAATGLGKTHLAAFDFKQSGFRNILFIVHREMILQESLKVFRQVLGNPDFGCLMTGTTSLTERKNCAVPDSSVFAMVQTLSNPEILYQLNPNHFDYMVVDEFHHAAASSYQKILEHFRPRFLLGITATPERMDGRDVLELCDYNVAYETRLFEAIDQGWLTPFQYFGIFDETDYQQVRWTGTGYDETELERHLSQDTRAELIINNLNRFLPSQGKIKALAFCATRGHAHYMTQAFIRKGISALCLLGENSDDERQQALNQLKDESHPLKVICSVDILGEGVDIPGVTHVLMLRPTLSFTVFLQQLGRGLRKVPQKEFLVVLDFVGNYRNSYIAQMVLRGYYSVDEYLEKKTINESWQLPEECCVDVDTQVQRIWDQEIRRILTPRNRREMLIDSYHQMHKILGHSPSLLDFLSNPEACEPHAFLKEFGNWLRVREACGDLSVRERLWLDTPAEQFLEHLEKDLRPNKSYKMVALEVLLEASWETTEWSIDWIAPRFLKYYLDHPSTQKDCTPLAKVQEPASVRLSEIKSLLKNNPLHFLSNTPGDFFTLNRQTGLFALKPEIHPYWQDEHFRNRVRECVSYALTRYFNLKGRSTSSNPEVPKHKQNKIIPISKTKPVIHKTALPFYPTLKMAAGIFRESQSDYEAELMEMDDPGQKYSANHHFVVRIEGDSMDGGKTPVHSGYLILLERLDATRAGSLTAERAIAVEYRDFSGETAYALKQIKKNEKGEYFLHSWNPKYPDTLIDPETLFPMARFIQIIHE